MKTYVTVFFFMIIIIVTTLLTCHELSDDQVNPDGIPELDITCTTACYDSLIDITIFGESVSLLKDMALQHNDIKINNENLIIYKDKDKAVCTFSLKDANIIIGSYDIIYKYITSDQWLTYPDPFIITYGLPPQIESITPDFGVNASQGESVNAIITLSAIPENYYNPEILLVKPGKESIYAHTIIKDNNTYSCIFDLQNKTSGNWNFALFCEKYETTVIQDAFTVRSGFGSGIDGNITIKSGYTVNIIDLYEKEDVVGVRTKNGDNKGLNHGAGCYDPEHGYFIEAINVTIEQDAILTTTAWGDGINNRLGVIYIECCGLFENNGNIDLQGKGGNGGAGGPESTNEGSTFGRNGIGVGNGKGGTRSGGIAGIAYGNTIISIDSNWAILYGSGGGGGSGSYDLGIWDLCIAGQGGGGAGNQFIGNYGQSTTNVVSPNYNGGGRGGNGGGALRIYTLVFQNNGIIICNGDNGYLGQSAGGGGGGGGSGGIIYIEGIDTIHLDENVIEAKGGSGYVTGSGYAGDGGNGADGRICICTSSQSNIEGTTNPPYTLKLHYQLIVKLKIPEPTISLDFPLFHCCVLYFKPIAINDS